jgi:micrococcal nuclease
MDGSRGGADRPQEDGRVKPLIEHTWVFPARIDRVIDGDTLEVTIDQGMHSFRAEHIRLLRVNTPEKSGIERNLGIGAMWLTVAWVKKRSTSDWPFLIHTEKADNFGRYLAEVTARSDGESLNQMLLEKFGPYEPKKQKAKRSVKPNVRQEEDNAD